MAIRNIIDDRGFVILKTNASDPHLLVKGTVSCSLIEGNVFVTNIIERGTTSALIYSIPVFTNSIATHVTSSLVRIMPNGQLLLPFGNDGFQNNLIRVVAPSGSADYSSISSAFASAPNGITVTVRPGTYYEDFFHIPRFGKLRAPDGGVIVISNVASGSLFTADNGAKIVNCQFRGQTSNSILFSATNNGEKRIVIENCEFHSASIACQGLTPNSFFELQTCYFEGNTTSILMNQQTSGSFFNITFEGNRGTCIDNAGDISVDAFTVKDTFKVALSSAIGFTFRHNSTSSIYNATFNDINTATTSPHTGSIELHVVNATLNNVSVPGDFTLNSGSYITIRGISGDLSNVRYNNNIKVLSHGFDTKKDEENFRIASDTTIGNPLRGRRLYTGEGRQQNSFICYSSSSSGVWTNVSTNAQTVLAPSFTFAGTGSNNALYFAEVVRNTKGIFQHIYGMEVELIQTASYLPSSSIIWETWNGSSWAKVESMATQLGEGYYDINTGSFDKYLEQTIRFNQNVVAQSVSTSLVSLGLTDSLPSLYWLRARISGALNASPVINHIRPMTNVSAFGPDGFLTFHGAARSYRTFPWSLIGTERGFLNVPADQDLGISDNLSVGFTNNNFVDGSVRQLGFVTALPLEIDTSTQTVLRFSFRPSTTGAGNVLWKARYAYSLDNETVYTSDTTAPTTGVREQVVTAIASGSFTAGQVRTMFISLPFEGFPTRQPGLGLSPIVWLTLERTGNDVLDTYTGDCQMVDVSGRYVAWCLGNHAAFFT